MARPPRPAPGPTRPRRRTTSSRRCSSAASARSSTCTPAARPKRRRPRRRPTPCCAAPRRRRSSPTSPSSAPASPPPRATWAPPTASSSAPPGSTARRATSSPTAASPSCGRRSGSAPSPPDQVRQRPFVDEFTSNSTWNWPGGQCFSLTSLRAATHGSGDATPGAPVQLGTRTPSWNTGSFSACFFVMCLGSSVELTRMAKWSGSVTGNGGASTVITEIWPTQVAPGPQASCGLVASTSASVTATPFGVDGTSAVVDCGFVALVVDPVLTVPPAGSTYCATTSVDGALTVTVVDAGRVMSSESSSPSPVADGTFMITVAEALSPDPSGPKLHVASPADFVHEPEEVTLTMLNPAGAGASRVVFGSEWDVPLWKVVSYATVVPAVTGFGEPVSVAVAVPPEDPAAGAAATRTATRAMSRVKYRRMQPPFHNR